jgi:hypothetical protein
MKTGQVSPLDASTEAQIEQEGIEHDYDQNENCSNNSG